jgi:GH35 family endo-1,4-beta-xylanase
MSDFDHNIITWHSQLVHLLRNQPPTGVREGVDWTKAGTVNESYIEKAFNYAHAIDPNALLFYNVSGSSRQTHMYGAVCFS